MKKQTEQTGRDEALVDVIKKAVLSLINAPGAGYIDIEDTIEWFTRKGKMPCGISKFKSYFCIVAYDLWTSGVAKVQFIWRSKIIIRKMKRGDK